jgi:acetyl esterase/lipase
VKNSVNLERALKAAGNAVTVRLYPALGHPDTVLALSAPFRAKAPILDEVAAFLHACAHPVADGGTPSSAAMQHTS